MNIMPKHDAQAIVANFDSQYLHCGASDEIAAPQFGHFSVCASIALPKRQYRERYDRTNQAAELTLIPSLPLRVLTLVLPPVA
jgi:hypothetical protein